MTGREVFQRAVALMNELDSFGTYHPDVADLEYNAPELLSIAVAELWSVDCLVRGVRPTASGYTLEPIRSLTDVLPLHDITCGCLPYLLSSMLLEEENQERSEHFYKLYLSLRSSITEVFTRGEWRPIRNVYS
ncbi:MAG: hypothetical protein IJP16_05320 [Clostridia bacterium]|nr:hypothetical protein [Clostridia bacterium]